MTATPAEGLIFDSEGTRAYSRWRLAVMLALSFLAHAAAFYILQVAYTPTGSLLPPPAQVVLIPPESAENAALARWIDLLDPSLMTKPPVRTAAQVLGTIGFHYVPSYATALQVFKPLPGQAAPEPPPQTRKPGPVPAGLLPPVVASAGKNTVAAAPRTQITFSSNLSALLPGQPPPLPPPATRAAKPLERTVYLLGVPASGGPAWIFRQDSSGDAADAAARAYLARLAFKPPPAPVWGWATIDWGRDAYPP